MDAEPPVPPDARHVPVMLEEAVRALEPALAPSRNGPVVLVDATLGLGGHTGALLARFPELSVVGLDRDAEALAAARERLGGFGERFCAEHVVFDALADPELADLVGRPSAFLFDLGVSSLQIDSDHRGFAYSRDTPLDMRMDRTTGRSAEDVINDYEVEELARVIKRYGEERQALRIARAIDAGRRRGRITTTGQLAELVASAMPAPRRGHPAKRVFQAVRIEVNDELGALNRGLLAALRLLRVNGRVAVLSYHSLEDRLVKRRFAEGISPSVPAGLPVIPPDRMPWLAPVTRGAQQAGADEVAANPRAASARLRVVQKLRPVPAEVAA